MDDLSYNKKPNYVYLLQEREFLKTKESILKVGKTKQDHIKRFTSYPKGSILIAQYYTDNCDDLEKEIIKVFKSKFQQRVDLGNEYFEGNIKTMFKTMFKIVENKFNPSFLPKKEEYQISSSVISEEDIEKDIFNMYKLCHLYS
jgi:hypothetical protein